VVRPAQKAQVIDLCNNAATNSQKSARMCIGSNTGFMTVQPAATSYSIQENIVHGAPASSRALLRQQLAREDAGAPPRDNLFPEIYTVRTDGYSLCSAFIRRRSSFSKTDNFSFFSKDGQQS
jgi:hypothetical protein